MKRISYGWTARAPVKIAFRYIGLSSWIGAHLLAQPVSYSHDVHPILAQRCLSCHTGSSAQGGLSLESGEALLRGGVSGAAIVPGATTESLLVQRISGALPPRMPFGGEPLSAGEMAVIETWIDQGAHWGSRSAKPEPIAVPLQLSRPPVPDADLLRSSHPIDRFVSAYWTAKTIAPENGLVPDAAFARRAYLDLWGFVPSPSQLADFESDDRSDKRARLVERLLANDRHYADHWISFWNDLLRNDEGVIYHGQRSSISTWLLDSLRKNRSYDKMVRALLNPVDEDDPEGFLLGVTWRGTINASQRPPIQAAQNSAQVFLGINLKCASCHDSFINQWKLADSYGLASLFSDAPLELVRCDTELGTTATPAFLYDELGVPPTNGSRRDRQEFAARAFTSPENGRFARTMVNRYWGRLLGRALVEPVDEMDRSAWSRDLLEWLAAEFVASAYDLKWLLKTIMTSKAYQLASVDEMDQADAYVFRGPRPRRLTAEQFADSVSAITGEWPVLSGDAPGQALYSREWRQKSSPLTRALGRPIRDQVYTTRNQKATTLQALELVNGGTLTRMLERAASRRVGTFREGPRPVFDSGVVTGNPARDSQSHGDFDIDVSGADRLWLLVTNEGSYDPSRVFAVLGRANFTGRNGDVRLVDLSAEVRSWTDRPTVNVDADSVAVTPPVEFEIDLAGKGLERFRSFVGVSQESRRSDINPRVRFFVFTEEPDRRRLVAPTNDPPLESPAAADDPSTLVANLYLHGMAREATADELRAAKAMLAVGDSPADVDPRSVEDLLWSVFMSPDFQFIR